MIAGTAPPDERVPAGDVEEQRERDDRAASARRAGAAGRDRPRTRATRSRTTPEQRLDERIRAGEPARRGARTRTRRIAAEATVRQPIGRPAGCSSSCSGQRTARRSAREPRATQPEGAHARSRAATTAVVRPCRPGQRQLDERGVGHAGRAARGVRRRSSGSSPCPPMSRWAHGTVRNSRRKRPLLISEPSAEPEFWRSPYQLSMSGT